MLILVLLEVIMSCFNPILAVNRGSKINKDGKLVSDIKILPMKGKFFACGIDDIKERYGDDLIYLPCGHCIGCANDYSKMWASRICLEASFHQANCFITLTYADCNLPKSLQKRDFQLFMKRLRKEIGVPVRYFACGEVGEGKGSREGYNPHFHAIIFGFDFPDKVFLKRSSSGLVIYRSSLLEKIWEKGLCSIGDVSPESAQYVSKYSMKRKITGVDCGEFVLMSRRPGIGVQGFNEDDYMTDKLYLHGRKYKIPRFFDKIAEGMNSFAYICAKFNRVRKAKLMPSKKYAFCVGREENALAILQENAVREHVLQGRSL